MIDYSSLGEKQFFAKFVIHDFGADNVQPWIMTMQNQNKITYLASNEQKQNSTEIVFNVINI